MKKINLENKTILVTGAAGFIGANLVLKLLHDVSCINIVGIDNMNDYYDVGIKEWRLEEIKTEAENNFTFIKVILLIRKWLTRFSANIIRTLLSI